MLQNTDRISSFLQLILASKGKLLTFFLHCTQLMFCMSSKLFFFLANKGELSSTACIRPPASMNCYFHAVLVILPVVWLARSPVGVGHVTAVSPQEFSFLGDVIQSDPNSTKWVFIWICNQSIYIQTSIQTIWFKGSSLRTQTCPIPNIR